MSYYIFLLTLVLVIFAVILFYQFYTFLSTDGRYRLYKRFKPFPKSYQTILLTFFPLYKKLPPLLQKRLQACILVFIKEKEFIGVKIDIDEQKKVLIAANACLLSIGHDQCDYKHVKSIFLYPEAVIKKEYINEGYIVSQENQILLGEAWQGGEVILSWRDLVAGVLNPNDGRNVGLHEFAHQLDLQDGVADGTPPLPWKMYREWSHIMQKEYKKIKEYYQKGKKSILDSYALTNAAEFFAVATETFFEKPKKLQQEEPKLYQLLKEYYALDPATWD